MALIFPRVFDKLDRLIAIYSVFNLIEFLVKIFLHLTKGCSSDVNCLIIGRILLTKSSTSIISQTWFIMDKDTDLIY